METYTAKTRSIGHRPRSKRLRELGGTVVTSGQAPDLSPYELLSNKVTEVDQNSTDKQYPTAKLLYDLYAAIGLTLQALQNGKADMSYVDTRLNSLTGSIVSIAGALQGKADANHQHAVSDVTNLQQALNSKSNVQHTHLITDLTNAAALFTQFALNSGVVSITIGGQQRSITLPTAATPSGDPMHYVYVKLGCSYNEQTGLWTYRDLDDLTTEQVNNAYVYTATERNSTSKTALYRESPVRFNFASDSFFQDNQVLSLDRFAQGNNTIEHIYINGSSQLYIVQCTITLTHAMVAATKLVAVHNILRVRNIYYESTGTNKCAFNGCPQLTYLRLMGLQNTIYYLHRNPLLSLDSIVYLVVNAAPTAAARYILHTDALARCTADTAEYTYQGNTYTGIVALAAARSITLTDVLPS